MDVTAAVGELRDVFEKAGSADGMPGDDELYGALLWAERNVGVLNAATDAVRRSAALTRVRLWQYLREQIDQHQLRAVDDARNARAEWADLAAPLAVTAASAAYNKAQRMRTATLADPELGAGRVRRTPEAAALAQRRIAAAEFAERRRAERAGRKHALTLRVARQLLIHRGDFVQDEDVNDWLDEIAAVVDDCNTPTRQVSLGTYVAATVRALKAVERRTAHSSAGTEESRAVLATALALLNEN
ncbi:hypothetical protein [Streptomyces sp. NPDC127084]|uniref:hypothetical protein n=1 Tax=Streptomyces sp. NPDC127084 TaxID=3347133 RepID=UPI00365ED8F4